MFMVYYRCVSRQNKDFIMYDENSSDFNQFYDVDTGKSWGVRILRLRDYYGHKDQMVWDKVSDQEMCIWAW